MDRSPHCLASKLCDSVEESVPEVGLGSMRNHLDEAELPAKAASQKRMHYGTRRRQESQARNVCERQERRNDPRVVCGRATHVLLSLAINTLGLAHLDHSIHFFRPEPRKGA